MVSVVLNFPAQTERIRIAGLEKILTGVLTEAKMDGQWRVAFVRAVRVNGFSPPFHFVREEHPRGLLCRVKPGANDSGSEVILVPPANMKIGDAAIKIRAWQDSLEETSGENQVELAAAVKHPEPKTELPPPVPAPVQAIAKAPLNADALANGKFADLLSKAEKFKTLRQKRIDLENERSVIDAHIAKVDEEERKLIASMDEAPLYALLEAVESAKKGGAR